MRIPRSLFLLFLLFVLNASVWAGSWIPLGPDGGDARSLAYDPQDPNHIFLGTSTGTIFHSSDGGKTWTRFAHVGTGDDSVIDHIVVDPRNSDSIYVAAWDLKRHNAGDLFHSLDGGKTWRTIPAMHQKSIRAMAIAAANPRILVVGTLDGIFRSEDAGRTWHKVSGQSTKIKNVESIAIDPMNFNVIYAGTWHLGWKTSDGGAHWQPLQEGIIDDSDIFSIIVDKSDSSTVFASACSGIYTSRDGGKLFEKVQAIPFSARRTRVLKQDPNNPAVILAGTTEGLWVTSDSGQAWKRVTDPELVVNDILVDPQSGRVLLATDRAGVLASDDGQHFVASNIGFTHRYISSMLTDSRDPNVLYTGIVNDRQFGGVFVSSDAGHHWKQISKGLEGRDVFALKQADDGTILAGTNHGILKLVGNGSEWAPINNDVGAGSEHLSARRKEEDTLGQLKVNDIELTSGPWLAATSAGLYTTSDEGKGWQRAISLGRAYLVSVRTYRDVFVVATTRKVLVSADHGRTWRISRGLPSYVNGIRSLNITPDNQIIVSSSSGAFRGWHFGAGWSRMRLGLPKNINFITFDNGYQRLVAIGGNSSAIYESKDGGRHWHRNSDSGYSLRGLGFLGKRLVAATQFDGIILQAPTENAR